MGYTYNYKRSFWKSVKHRIAFLLRKLWYRISTSKKNRTLDEVQKKVENAVVKKQIKQDLLRQDILLYIRKKLNLKRRSKYIPFTTKNKEEIKKMVIAEFGEKMKLYDITITNNLELK